MTRLKKSIPAATEKKKLSVIVAANEEKLRTSEQRFRIMVDAVRDYAIMMLDADGYITSWNEGAKRITGYEASEIIGQHFSKFYLPEDIERNHPANEINEAVVEGRFEEENFRLRKDGTKFWASVIITRIDNAEGKPIGFAKITRDLTERRKAEQALKQANEHLEIRVKERTKELEMALKARDEFLSIASHELKTPITSLNLQLQMTRRKVNVEANIAPPPKALAAALDLGIRQAHALTTLINDLLDVSRIRSGSFSLDLEPLNLSEVIEDVLLRFSQQLNAAGCVVQLQLDKTVCGVWDRRRIEQVIVNMLSNAIKYAPQKPLKIITKFEGKRAIIGIEDQGPGIDESEQDQIFERYVRVNSDRHISGLGLGLFIVRKIVEAHNGNIHVESQLGKGTKFIIELPLL